jgi:hypothetical protein
LSRSVPALQKIARAKAHIARLEIKIWQLESELKEAAASAFNAETRGGGDVTTTADADELCLGSQACTKSPIGICVYSEMAKPIPVPEKATWLTTQCLFCGVEGEEPPQRSRRYFNDRDEDD